MLEESFVHKFLPPGDPQIADDDNPDFGMDDGDWSVYSDIVGGGGIVIAVSLGCVGVFTWKGIYSFCSLEPTFPKSWMRPKRNYRWVSLDMGSENKKV